MRFRPANISLINRRHLLPRLLLTLSSIEENDQRTLTGHYISGKSSRIHEVECQEKSARYLGALWRARISIDQDPPLRISASRLVVPALVQNRTSICSLRLRRVRTED